MDMTEDIVAKGSLLAEQHGYDNVESRLGYIEQLPVAGNGRPRHQRLRHRPDPRQTREFKEVYRVLKPGGRILIADLVTAGELPPDVRASAAAWADCLAGAMPKAAYLETIRRAGFAEVGVVSESPYEAPGMDARCKGK